MSSEILELIQVFSNKSIHIFFLIFFWKESNGQKKTCLENLANPFQSAGGHLFDIVFPYIFIITRVCLPRLPFCVTTLCDLWRVRRQLFPKGYSVHSVNRRCYFYVEMSTIDARSTFTQWYWQFAHEDYGPYNNSFLKVISDALNIWYDSFVFTVGDLHVSTYYRVITCDVASLRG